MRKLFGGDKKNKTTEEPKGAISYQELEQEFAKMVAELRLPAQAAENMLKMPQSQKLEMLKAHKLKKQTQRHGDNGKEWANKFSNANGASPTNPATIEHIQKFVAALKDSNASLVNDFISELGLNHLCHLGSKMNAKFDKQLLLVFKGMIDAQGNVVSLINHPLAILIIVQKIDTQDNRVRELAVQLLVSLVAVDSDVTGKAVDDIMSALSGQANGFYGSRNRWKPIIEHLNSSALYDTLSITLINLLLGSLPNVEARVEERRLLNAEHFEHMLHKMEEGIERSEKKHKYNKYGALTAQIEAYFGLSKEDFEVTTDLNNPQKLFNVLESQVLRDGYINELTSIMNNLITIPASANNVWQNISRIVGQACLPIQKKMLQKAVSTDNNNNNNNDEKLDSPNSGMNALGSFNDNNLTKQDSKSQSRNSKNIPLLRATSTSNNASHIKQQSGSMNLELNNNNDGDLDNRLRGKSSSIRGVKVFDDVRRFDYPTYEALKLLLNVKEQEDDYITGDKAIALKTSLEHERQRTLKLEREIKKLREKLANIETQFKNQKESNYKLRNELENAKAAALRAANNNNNMAGDNTAVTTQPQGQGQSQGPPQPPHAPINAVLPPPPIPMAASATATEVNEDGTKVEKPIQSIQSNPAAAAVAASLQQKKEESSGSITSLVKSIVSGDDGYNKYRKMLKMGIPVIGVVNKMYQDSVDKTIIEKFESSGVLPGGNDIGGGSSRGSGTAAGLPRGLPPPVESPKANGIGGILGLGGAFGGKRKSGSSSKKKEGGKLTLEEEEKVTKYRKMLKMQLPKDTVINKMKQDGIDASLISKMFGETASAEKKEPELPPNLEPREKIVPNVKMRNLHWQKISPFDVESSIWNRVNNDPTKRNMEIDAASLESRFCAKPSKSKDSNSESSSSSKKKKNKDAAAADTISVLDSKRSYNVEIFLGRMRMDNWAIREGMLTMDESVFNKETIEKFINFVPTPEEAQLLDAYEDEPLENLGKAERFFKIVKSVDPLNLKERLELWLFKLMFHDKLNDEIKIQINLLKNGCECINNSENFLNILSIILSIGNYMNGNTRKGCAYGFKLSSLTQLTRSRSIDNKETLLEYLYGYLLNSNNELYKNSLNFIKEFEIINEACKVDLPQLRKNIGDMNIKLRKINTRINSENIHYNEDDMFTNVMKPFYDNAIIEFENVKQLHTNVINNTIKNTTILLNETNDTTCEFLKTLNQFRKDFIKIENIYNNKQEKLRKEAEKAQRKAEKQAKIEAKRSKNSSPVTSPSSKAASKNDNHNSKFGGNNNNNNNNSSNKNSPIPNSTTATDTPSDVSAVEPPPVPSHILMAIQTSIDTTEEYDDFDVNGMNSIGNDDNDDDDDDVDLPDPSKFRPELLNANASTTSLTDSIVQGLRATHNSAEFLKKLEQRRGKTNNKTKANLLNET